ncbi:hypothetical protein TGDOM2_294660 [Toxoplasma gondii GAB2-2007-GAL-DOM2]|uniref:Uncharacterized protein n=2 Tax=Toxoplasma gondii TaxID=5811 RepID=A0A086KQS4_TOXGO|nr:hypothetical protein TGDOM2_294660 [Toxoplasma gondii GAB2-2007-GAL-DOM2]KFG46742.1 hypothetical protein TGFOU_294660 [Toxoplasma gondii FOU]
MRGCVSILNCPVVPALPPFRFFGCLDLGFAFSRCVISFASFQETLSSVSRASAVENRVTTLRSFSLSHFLGSGGRSSAGAGRRDFLNLRGTARPSEREDPLSLHAAFPFLRPLSLCLFLLRGLPSDDRQLPVCFLCTSCAAFPPNTKGTFQPPVLAVLPRSLSSPLRHPGTLEKRPGAD